jgi:hypothetical protein
MRIIRDYKNWKFWLSQAKYIEKVFQKFIIDKCKLITSSIASHFKLSHDGCPKSNKEKKEIKNISYVSVIGSLIYAMVYIRSDIAHAVGVVSRFLSNPGKVH